MASKTSTTLRLLVLVVFSVFAKAELYHCEDVSGRITVTDRPCVGATRYEVINPIQTLMIKAPSPAEKQFLKSVENSQSQKPSKTMPDSCRRFSSTELRNLRVKDDFEKGMPQSEIKKRFGLPDLTEMKTDGSEKWVYQSERVNRVFRFKHACLLAWTERWKKTRSKMSKYNE